MPESPDPGRLDRTALRIVVAAGVPLLAGAGSLLLYLVDPARSRILPACPTYLLTGIYCPGCGTARMLHSLLHLRLVEALDHNVLMVFLLPVVLYAGLATYLAFVFGRSLIPALRIAHWISLLILVAIVVFTVLRNLPFSPFTYLAP
jgi:hypothetical protein